MTHEHDNDSGDDTEIFRAAVGKVKPLAKTRTASSSPRPQPIPRQRLEDERLALRDSLANTYAPDVQPGEVLEFHRQGLPRTVLTQLRRGRFRIEAEIDLHGMTAVAAEEQLDAFLQEARLHGLRCVRVIHGKGLRSGNSGPVLKTRVPNRLVLRDDVLAFVSARPADGGTGALYVLLRSRRDQ